MRHLGRMARASTDSWVGRLKLLDDLPLGPKAQDLFGLGERAKLLADTIVRTRGPLVVHVDGSWGRGKTSFCWEVERRLAVYEDRVRSARYVASDDAGDGAQSLFYAVAKAIAGPEDPEEAARILRQWSDDEGLGGMRMDAFSTWLRHELGRSSFEPERESVRVLLNPARGEAGGSMELSLEPNPERSAVVFVDDLDRCSHERVVEVLRLIRRFVACPGLAFIIAADRKLIQRAFEDIVEREADRVRTSAAEAMEKYIHRRVELPGFESFSGAELASRLERFQRGMFKDGGEGQGEERGGEGRDGDERADENFRLLCIPHVEFAQGVALRLVQDLGASLTPRRLKRILNDFLVDMASFVDREGRSVDLASPEAWEQAWRTPRRGFKPVFELRRGASLPAYFIGRLLVRVCEHAWPGLLAGLSPRDDEFTRRSGRLLALAAAEERLEGTQARVMIDEVLLALDSSETTPLHLRRELLAFFAWVERARRSRASVHERWAEHSMMGEPEKHEAVRETFLNHRDHGAARMQRAQEIPMSATLESMPAPKREPVGEVTRGGGRRDAAREAVRGGIRSGTSEAKSAKFDSLFKRALVEGEKLDQPEARAQFLYLLELLIGLSSASEQLDPLVDQLADEASDPKRVRSAQEFESLLSLAHGCVQRGYRAHARALFSLAYGAAGSPVELLRWGASYLPYLLAGDRSEKRREAVSWRLEELCTVMDSSTEDPEFEELVFRVWLVGARLAADPPPNASTWPRLYRAYREWHATRYLNEGGRETTRRYVMLVRAEGGDDPNLDQLQRNRAALVSERLGDPDIIQAYADILVSRGRRDAYLAARRYYPRLQGTPQWTPQVLHNLATAINALEPMDDRVGGLWIEAHRRAPQDLVIRRALGRFLVRRGYSELAASISTGQTLPDDFNPPQFDASELLAQSGRDA